MRSILTESLPNTFFSAAIPPGKYVGIFYVFTGTNQSGQAVTADQLGSIKTYFRGNLHSYIDFKKLIYYNGFKGGSVSSTSTAGSSFLFTGFLPFVLPEDGVALYVENPDDWKVEVSSTMTSTVVALGTLYIAGVVADDADLSPYELYFQNYDVSQSGAGTYPVTFTGKNIIELYIEQDANLTHIEVLKDNNSFFSYLPITVANAYTNYFTKTESFTSTPGYYFVDLNPSKELAGSIANRIDLNYTLSGSATLQMFYISMYATPTRMALSAIKRNAAIEAKAANLPQNVANAIKSGKIE